MQERWDFTFFSFFLVESIFLFFQVGSLGQAFRNLWSEVFFFFGCSLGQAFRNSWCDAVFFLSEMKCDGENYFVLPGW